jgi:hypothetical protein
MRSVNNSLLPQVTVISPFFRNIEFNWRWQPGGKASGSDLSIRRMPLRLPLSPFPSAVDQITAESVSVGPTTGVRAAAALAGVDELLDVDCFRGCNIAALLTWHIRRIESLTVAPTSDGH